jgi:hypothetical protein
VTIEFDVCLDLEDPVHSSDLISLLMVLVLAMS